jgi:DNA-binding transcriptional MerR regulator
MGKTSMSQTMRIGEVAQQTGLTVDAIRFYEKQRLLKRPPRTKGGFRLFGAQDLQHIQFICKAQELGFSLKEIRELLILQGENIEACSHVRELLQAKLGAVREKISELQKMESILARDLKKCQRSLREPRALAGHDCCPVLDEIAKTTLQRTAKRHED